MTLPRFKVIHWKRVKRNHLAKEGNAACKSTLRVPETNTTTNVDRVTCKVCKKFIGMP